MGDSQGMDDRVAAQAEPEPTDVGGTEMRPGQTGPVGARRGALAPETLRLYAADWMRFSEYCGGAGVRALPATVATVAAFLQVPGPGRAARSRRLAAIDHRHRQRGLSCPGDDPAGRRALKQARAAAPRRTRPAPPSSAALRSMALRCPRDLGGLRDRAVLLLLALGLPRRQVVGLQAEGLRWTEDGVRAEGTTIWAPRLALHDLCPARALEDWLRASGTSYGPVFRKVTRWGTVEPKPLGADAIRLILARRST